MTQAVYDYQTDIKTSEAGQVTSFMVKGRPLGVGVWVALAVGLFFPFVFVGAYWENFPAGFIVEAIVVAGIVIFINLFRCKQIQLSVSKEKISRTVDGQTSDYDLEHVKKFYIKNEKSGQSYAVDNTRLVGGGFGFAGFSAAGMAVMGNAAKDIGNIVGQLGAESLAKTAFSLRIVYGSKDVPLVKYLKQDTATALFTDIGKALEA